MHWNYENFKKWIENGCSPDDAKNLSTLYLEDNQIRILPDCFECLINIKILDLRENEIATLPDSFRFLTNIERLFLITPCKLSCRI